MGRGEESKGEREGKGEKVEGKKGGVRRVSGRRRGRGRRKEERAREKSRGKTEKVEKEQGKEGGGVRHLIMTSEVQLCYTETDNWTKAVELLLTTPHLLRCLDSAVYYWSPGKTAPKQSS